MTVSILFILRAEERLLNHFAESDQKEKVRKALAFATEAHQKQTRMISMEPYIIHPIRVALILIEELGVDNVDAVCAALLHDVVEDCNKAVGELQENFGVSVAIMVNQLTKPTINKVLGETKEDMIARYFNTIENASDSVKFIKIADRIDNIRDVPHWPEKDRKDKYKQETIKHVLPIAQKLTEAGTKVLEGALEKI